MTEKAVSQYSNDELSIAFNGGKGFGFKIRSDSRVNVILLLDSFHSKSHCVYRINFLE